MNDELYKKLISYDFPKLFNDKGYVWYFKGCYNLNIIGIRCNSTNVVTNKFDDAIVLDYYTKENKHKRSVWSITTFPGKYYMNNPCTTKGTAILVPGQYQGAYAIDLHKGKYQALCQKLPVKVYRDNNRDNIYDLDPQTIEKGIIGLNIHRASKDFTSTKVDNWSAACQVFSNPSEFNAFMTLCKKQVASGHGNKFTYTLLDINELI